MELGDLPPGAVSEVGTDMPPGALHPVLAKSGALHPVLSALEGDKKPAVVPVRNPRPVEVKANTWEELARNFGVDPEKLGLAKGTALFNEWKQLESEAPQSGMGLVKKLAKQGSSIWRGTQQGLYNILGNESESAAAKLYENMIRYDKARKGESGLTSFATESALDLPFMAIMPGGPIAGAGAKAGVNVAKAAATGGALGFLSPTVSESPLTERIASGVLGAATAPIFQRGTEEVVGLGSKLLAGRPKALGGSLPPEIAERQRMFNEAGLRATTTDLDPQQAKLSGLRDLLETAPSLYPGDINMGQQNRLNTSAAPLSVAGTLTPARARAVSEPFSQIQFLQEMASKGNDQAKLILTKIAEAQNKLAEGQGKAGLAEVMAADIESQVFSRKHNPELGTNAAREAANALVPQQPISTTDALSVVRDILKREAGSVETGSNPELLNQLRNIERDLTTLTSGDKNLVSSIPSGGGPVTISPGQEASPQFLDQMGLIQTGRGPVIGGAGPVAEVRDAYGTIIEGAKPAVQGVGTPYTGQMPTPAVEGTMGRGPTQVPIPESNVQYQRLDSLYNAILQLQSDFTSPRSVFVNATEAGKLGPIREVVKRLRDQAAQLPGNEEFLAALQRKGELSKELLGPAGTKMPTDLAATTGEGIGDTFANKIIDMSPDQLAQLIKPMGEKGRKAAVLSVLEDVAANMRNSGPESINFDQQKATVQLRKALKALKTIGTDAERVQVKALETVISSLTKMNDFQGKPLTWTRLYTTAIPAMFKFLLTTDPGKRMAFAISASREGSALRQSLLQKAEQMVGAQMGQPMTREVEERFDVNY